MKKRFPGITAILLAAVLFSTACGSSSDTPKISQPDTSSQEKSEAASEQAIAADSITAEGPEAEDSSAATNTETEDAAASSISAASSGSAVSSGSAASSVSDASSASDASSSTSGASSSSGTATDAGTDEVHPYAWMGLQDIPQCNYLDILATNHYIQTYDSYVSTFSVEETAAVDGINTYTENENERIYSVDGKVLSINENSKIYIEQDVSSLIEEAKANLQAAMEMGTNLQGRSFVDEGTGTIPLVADAENGDTAEYSYYEYNYPEAEAMGTPMTERYYMKDNDVYAIYQSVSYGEDTKMESVKVIKSISGEIPDGTFDLPDLSGYDKYE